MGELIAFLIVVAAVKKFLADPIIDGIYAARGQDSPRMAAVRQQRAADGVPARYGAGDYFRDLLADFWEDMRAGRDAARNADGGERVSWWERWRAARDAMGRARRTAYRKLIDPVGGPADPAPVPAPDPVESVEPPYELADERPEPGTVRFTDTGREQWDGTAWVPYPEPRTAPKTVLTSQEEPMTAATGEAVNFETAIAQLDAIDEALDQMNRNVDIVENERNDIAAAAETLQQSLAALSLDAETLDGVGQLLDFIDPDFVMAIIDKTAAAKNAVAATRAHLIATYGDAADTVASTGVDSGFLNA